MFFFWTGFSYSIRGLGLNRNLPHRKGFFRIELDILRYHIRMLDIKCKKKKGGFLQLRLILHDSLLDLKEMYFIIVVRMEIEGPFCDHILLLIATLKIVI
jgi:hypothetical protein